VTPTAKNPDTRETRFTGPGKGCLFFVTFFGASKESKAMIFTTINLLPRNPKKPWFKLIINKALQAPLFSERRHCRTFWKNYSDRKLDYRVNSLRLRVKIRRNKN